MVVRICRNPAPRQVSPYAHTWGLPTVPLIRSHQVTQMDLKVGQQAQRQTAVTHETVKAYAELTGD